MASQGTVIARVYTSEAFLPLQGVPVVFTQTSESGEQSLLAFRLTDSSGLTAPLTIQTPDTEASLNPENTLLPFASIDIRVSFPGYSSVDALGVQIFPGVETIQGIQLRPVSTDEQDERLVFPEPPQNL